MVGSSIFVRLQGHLVCLMGMLKSLSGMFMPSQVILFLMALRGRMMSVSGKIVKFSGFSL
jgi:hypothetical protein